MSELKLKIVTPDRVFFQGEIISVTARGVEGDFTILRNHAPFVTVIQISKMKIRTEEESRIAAISGGYITVKDNDIVIMSDACEWADEIDMQRAEHAKQRAEKRLESVKGEKDVLNAELALKRALNRLQTGQGK